MVSSTFKQLIIIKFRQMFPLLQRYWKKDSNISENYLFQKFELPIIRRNSCSPLHFELLRFDCTMYSGPSCSKLLTFFQQKILGPVVQSYSHFFSKKFQRICVSPDVNFNESLTNDVVSFEQLGPDVHANLCLQYHLCTVSGSVNPDPTGLWYIPPLQTV